MIDFLIDNICVECGGGGHFQTSNRDLIVPLY